MNSLWKRISISLFVLLVVNGRETSIGRYTTEVDEQGWWKVNNIWPYEVSIESNNMEYVYFRSLNKSQYNSCYEFKLNRTIDNRVIKSFCYPSIIIGGYMKCGTTALYKLFGMHPEMKALNRKELCLRMNTVEHLLSFLPESDDNKYLISGCIHEIDNFIMQELLRKPKVSYIFVLRSIVDWLWSAYNFWCDSKLEKCIRKFSDWAFFGANHRSASDFDKIIRLSILSHNFSITPEKMVPMLKDKLFYQNYSHRIWEFLSNKSTIFIANEQFEMETEVIWDILIKFLGLSISKHPHIRKFKSFRYNTQDNKGAENSVSVHNFTKGAYSISNFESIHKETRQLLDNFWYDDCKFISELTKFRYPSCH